MFEVLYRKLKTQVDALALSATPRGYIDGLAISNDGADATNDIQVAPGTAASTLGSLSLTIATAVVKQIDVAFAEYSAPGTASGGRDSADNTTGAKWFHVHVIGGSGKNSQPFLSTSLTPTLPSGFTARRRIGSVYWTGSAISPFVQRADDFFWTTPVADFSSTVGNTYSNIALTVPSDIVVRPFISSFFARSGATPFGLITNPNTGPAAPASSTKFTHYPVGAAGAAVPPANGLGHLYTDTSRQVRATADAASTSLTIITYGWRDPRDRDAA